MVFKCIKERLLVNQLNIRVNRIYMCILILVIGGRHRCHQMLYINWLNSKTTCYFGPTREPNLILVRESDKMYFDQKEVDKWTFCPKNQSKNILCLFDFILKQFSVYFIFMKSRYHYQITVQVSIFNNVPYNALQLSNFLNVDLQFL